MLSPIVLKIVVIGVDTKIAAGQTLEDILATYPKFDAPTKDQIRQAIAAEQSVK